MNKNLNSKKYDGRDEFYTTEESAGYLFQTIDLNSFAGKIVYCNCDGPESEIYKWLKKRYKALKLKQLFATKLVRDGKGVKTVFDGKIEVVSQLVNDGDCFSEECQTLLDECDIVCTNPPFSRLGDYIPMIFNHSKDFAIIANLMCLGNKKNLHFLLSGKINVCDLNVKARHNSGNAWPFVWKDNSIAYVWCNALTTLKTLPTSRKLPHLTTAELAKKNKLHYEDTTKEMEVSLVQNIPTDLQGTCLAPITAALIPEVKAKYEIIGLAKSCVVNGKNRFYRIRIKRKTST